MVILANNLNNNRKLVSFHGNANANNNCLKRNPSFLIDNEVHSTLSYGGVSSPVAGKSSFQVQHDRLKRPQSAVPTGRKSRSSFQVEILSSDQTTEITIRFETNLKKTLSLLSWFRFVAIYQSMACLKLFVESMMAWGC